MQLRKNLETIKEFMIMGGNPLRILLDKDDKINFRCFHFEITEHLCFHNKNSNEKKIGHRALPFPSAGWRRMISSPLKDDRGRPGA